MFLLTGTSLVSGLRSLCSSGIWIDLLTMAIFIGPRRWLVAFALFHCGLLRKVRTVYEEYLSE